MYYHEKYQPKVRLWNRQGRFWEYENIVDAAKRIPHQIKKEIGEDFDDYNRNFYRSVILLCRKDYLKLLPSYVLRTEFNESIHPDELNKGPWDGHYHVWICWLPFKRKIYPGFRNGPVPRTGVRHWGGVRHMQTTQEIRENTMLVNDTELREYGIKVRGKRMNIPNSRDDYFSPFTKNWKKYRKHQWRENE